MSGRKHDNSRPCYCPENQISSNELVAPNKSRSKDKTSKNTTKSKIKSKRSAETKTSSNTKDSSLTRNSSRTKDSSSKGKSTSDSDYDDRPNTEMKIKFGFPVIMVPWNVISKMVLFSYLLNASCVVYSILLMVFSIKTRLMIGDFLDMVSSGDGTVIPVVLFLAGLFCLPMNLGFIYATWQSCVRCRSRKINNVQFALVMVNFFMVAILVFMGIFCVVYAFSSMQDRLHSGILSAMRSYKNNSSVKKRIDTMQIEFQCCGSKSYSEWFDIPWYDTTLATTEVSQATRDDAPFSCCSRHSLYPCVHHDLMSVGSAYLYAPETNLSVSEHGCHFALLRHAQVVAGDACTALLLLALLQAGVGTLQRLLQTAHAELGRFERNSHWHTAWVLGCYRGKRAARGKARGRSRPRPPPIPDELMR